MPAMNVYDFLSAEVRSSFQKKESEHVEKRNEITFHLNCSLVKERGDSRMQRKIALVKWSGFGLLWLYSLCPLIAPSIFVMFAPFAQVIVGVYVLLTLTCLATMIHYHTLDRSLVVSIAIFAFATIFASLWPTAIGYVIYFICVSIAYAVPTFYGWHTFNKS